MSYDDGTEVPTDGDERPKGGTNRLAGLSGLGIGFAVVILVLVVVALALTFFTGQPGLNL
jgi:hypothetical protein